MNVTNLNSPRTGNPVANQYEIITDDTVYFQSYQTVIARKDGYKLTISDDWNYSRTTAKYFYQWLGLYGYNDLEIEHLKKWLRKPSTKVGDSLIELLGRKVDIMLVGEL